MGGPKEKRPSAVSKFQLLFPFLSTAPATGELVPVTRPPNSTGPSQAIEIKPVDPKIVKASKARSDAVEEDTKDRNAPYTDKPDSFPDVI